jgi:hypothetical protein
MKKFILTAAAALLAASPAFAASEYAEALGDCAYKNLNSQDKVTLTQWAFVTIGKTKAAQQVTAIPEAKTKQVDAGAKQLMNRIVTQNCAKESAQVALHDPKNGMKTATAVLAQRLLEEQLQGRFSGLFPEAYAGDAEKLQKGVSALKGFLKR